MCSTGEKPAVFRSKESRYTKKKGKEIIGKKQRKYTKTLRKEMAARKK